MNGEMIKNLRIAKGYTQERLGEKLGVTKATIQKYESGDIVNLKLDTIRKLCEIFDINPVRFIFDNEETEKISKQVYAIEIIQEMYGRKVVEILSKLMPLSKNDREEVILKMLHMIDTY